MAVEKFRITRENIYNFDENMFIIGIDITLLWIITYKELINSEIIKVSQDSNKKWVLLLIKIYVIILIILSTLIYQKKSDNLRNT